MSNDTNFICTVLCITYNHEPYFKTAIESVLEQNTDYNFKIHIFDDGSTDGTSDIVREYAKKYPDVITAFIAPKNQGAQTNIWNAYKSVDTKYCVMLECDDYWCDETKLQLQIDALEANPECVFCAHNTLLKTLDEKTREYPDDSFWITRKMFKLRNIIHYCDIEPIDIGGYIPHISSRVIRIEYLDLDKIQNKETILFDFNQYFYLIIKGPYYYIDKTMSVYIKTGQGTHSGKSPLEVLNNEFPLICDFNKETNFVIADKIFREYRLQIDHRLNLYYYYRYDTDYKKRITNLVASSSNSADGSDNEIEDFHSTNTEMLHNQLVQLNREFTRIRKSKEYKLGRLIFLFPKKFRVACISCRDIGFRRTFNNIIRKIIKVLRKKFSHSESTKLQSAIKENAAVDIDVLKYKLDKDVYYFLCSAGIGDTLLVCGLKHELEKKYDGKIHLLIPGAHEFLMEMYECSEYTLTDFSHCDLRALSDNTPVPKKGRIFVAHPHVHNELELFFAPIREQISVQKFYPWFLEFLDMNKDTQFKNPLKTPQMSDSFRKTINEIAPVEKIALVSPEATSMLWLPWQFWEDKVKQLKHDGLTVISNVKNPACVIKGSKYLPMELTDVVSLAFACHSVYSLRSGFCDAIYQKGKDLHVYYPRHSSLYIYSLNDLFDRRDIDEQIILV